jgi:hypothetical protein
MQNPQEIPEEPILASAGQPIISSFPQTQVVYGNSDASFAVLAVGNPPLSYQWEANGTDLNMGTNATLAVHDVTQGDNGSYVVRIRDGTGRTNIAAAQLLVKPPGTVVGWGEDGQTPAQVPDDLANVSAIASGTEHSLALRTDGTVFGWGSINAEEVSGLNDAVAIAAGFYHSLVLRKNGTVVGWGYNDYHYCPGIEWCDVDLALCSSGREACEKV